MLAVLTSAVLVTCCGGATHTGAKSLAEVLACIGPGGTTLERLPGGDGSKVRYLIHVEKWVVVDDDGDGWGECRPTFFTEMTSDNCHIVNGRSHESSFEDPDNDGLGFCVVIRDG